MKLFTKYVYDLGDETSDVDEMVSFRYPWKKQQWGKNGT
jgi:hypothetical protein